MIELMCRTCRGKGQYAGLDITCRACHGSGIEPISNSEPTDRQRLLSEWTDTCKAAIEKCPMQFMAEFVNIMFTGQRIIIESSVCAEIDGAKMIAGATWKGQTK